MFRRFDIISPNGDRSEALININHINYIAVDPTDTERTMIIMTDGTCLMSIIKYEFISAELDRT